MLLVRSKNQSHEAPIVSDQEEDTNGNRRRVIKESLVQATTTSKVIQRPQQKCHNTNETRKFCESIFYSILILTFFYVLKMKFPVVMLCLDW